MQNTKLSPLEWHNEKRKVADLIANKKSPRKISKEQTETLKKSLEKFNLVEIPAIDLDGTLLAGHKRVKVMIALGRGQEMIDILNSIKLT